jgi:circadian clock protein KaiC
VRIERSEIEETGEYDLEGLFIRLGHAVDRIGAKRLVLDTLEALFVALPNEAVLRAELRRLFRWIKDRGLTAVITGERGKETLTRHGLEEYVADCVILLDHRVRDQVSTRRLRILKYRGSAHGTNEYPFLITEKGFSVLPITALTLQHHTHTQRVSSGIPTMDDMMGGKGYFRGSSILVTGSAGTGKSSLAAAFANAACARGERAMIFAYEESPMQLARNMSSIGIHLNKWIKKDLLRIHASRPTLSGLEQHLVHMHQVVEEFKPSVVVVDPISNLTVESSMAEVNAMLMRLIDHLKTEGITALFTVLTGSAADIETSEVGVSSLMDTWILLRNVEDNGERSRLLVLVKSRGMAHSNQLREFVLSDQGIDLIDIYVEDGRVLVGRARQAAGARRASGNGHSPVRSNKKNPSPTGSRRSR